MDISLYNTLTRQTELLKPIRAGKVGMYVCGPTVYDHPHIGNARADVVYDVLYRLLSLIYGKENIDYVRNITDVDDKINQAAIQNGETIQQLTTRITKIFHADMVALNSLSPTKEPKATEHIAEMIEIITKLINANHAYIANGHVYYAVESFADYGKLAGRELKDMIAGARVEITEAKKHPGDFVLWKPADDEDDPSSIFDSPWGKGRPGWHIECSAMSSKYLGNDFDIHGGGADLMFPHHTNEIAQSCAAHKGSNYARMWVHNGFLTVNGEKMSKSLGNFVTVRELLNKGIKGEVIRLLLMSTHYRKPLDFNDKSLLDAKKTLDSFYRALANYDQNIQGDISPELIKALADDLNTPEAITILHNLVKQINKSEHLEEQAKLASMLKASANLMGILTASTKEWFQNDDDHSHIDQMLNERNQAKKDKNWQLADQIRNDLKSKGIVIEDHPDGTSSWRKI